MIIEWMGSCRNDINMDPTDAKPYYHYRQFNPACPRQAEITVNTNTKAKVLLFHPHTLIVTGKSISIWLLIVESMSLDNYSLYVY